MNLDDWVCPVCRSINSANHSRCYSCQTPRGLTPPSMPGSGIPAGYVDTPRSASTPSQLDPPARRDLQRFCAECGTPRSGPYCPGCGRRLDGDGLEALGPKQRTARLKVVTIGVVVLLGVLIAGGLAALASRPGGLNSLLGLAGGSSPPYSGTTFRGDGFSVLVKFT